MKSFNTVSVPDPKSRSCICSLFMTVALICGVYFTGSALVAKDFRALPGFVVNHAKQNEQCKKCEDFTFEMENFKLISEMIPPGTSTEFEFCNRALDSVPENYFNSLTDVSGRTQVPLSKQEKQESRVTENVQNNKCQKKCRPLGSEALPEGIVSKTSNLEMRPLWGDVEKKTPHSVNLLGIAVGIKQKELVDKIVKKFLEHNFVVMLFHYDGVVDEWNDLDWSSRAVHVSAMNQTKWWFAKRFLHPDIVSEYDYIFLWDEDLGVENFHPEKYISIIREEGLEISQPALDASKSEVHHHITVRRGRSKVHRRFYRLNKSGRTCDNNSTEPPCVGWVEMMAPVFSKAAWRCAWYMVQNDLIHAWGLDMKLGYCAQGDRTRKVGVVDAEYITHLAVPTLGANSDVDMVTKELDHSLQGKNLSDSDALVAPVEKFDNRSLVRRQSYIEMKIFRDRWRKATKQDQCWVDPFQSRKKGRKATRTQ